MSDDNADSTSTDDANDPDASGLDRAKHLAADAKVKASEAAKKVGEKMPPQVKETYDKVAEKASDAAKKATPVVKDTYEKVSTKAKSLFKSDDDEATEARSSGDETPASDA